MRLQEDIWPWLVQIGYQRGGLYSYDWLDRLFGFLDRPSAVRVLPEFQQLAVGDKVPWGRTGTELTVGVLEPLRALALSYRLAASRGCGSSVCIRLTSNGHGSSRAAQSVSRTHCCGGWACA